jgi:hypothetical protein
MLPPFDGHGNLPSGDYWPAESDFEARFVAVHGSASREQIYNGFKHHRAELVAAGVDGDAPSLLNGSYTTSKLDPGDIDLVVEVDADAFMQSARQQELLRGPENKPEFSCDAYPLLVLPADHPQYEQITVKGRSYWHKWFARDRANNPKGRVWTSVRGFR